MVIWKRSKVDHHHRALEALGRLFAELGDQIAGDGEENLAGLTAMRNAPSSEISFVSFVSPVAA
jgi:hypothetical protein